MKIITPIVLAGIALALCGCSTDSPVFANEATQANESARGDTTANTNGAAEQQRDAYNQMNSGGAMTGQGGNANPQGAITRDMGGGNSYGH